MNLLQEVVTIGAAIDWTTVNLDFDATELLQNAVGFFGELAPVIMVIGGISAGLWLLRAVVSLIPGG